MASRISQMRNGTLQPQLQPLQNDAIANVRALMQQVKGAENQQAMLAQILQNNPNTAFIANMLSKGNSLEAIARQMASAQGVDIDQLISQLVL